MCDACIFDDETLNRAILSCPNLWNDIECRPTSAVFKDKKGVSVDRDGGRSDIEIAKFIHLRFGNSRAHAVLDVSFVKQLRCKIESNKLEENEYHALIKGENTTSPSNSQAKQMATKCRIVDNPKTT